MGAPLSPAITAAILTTAACLSATEPAFAQDASEERFGRVHFATSCNEVAQRRFDRAMRYQHSFWYSQSKELFEEVLAADPACAMAYWGIALSLLYNPHIQTPPENLAPGLAALEKGRALGAKTQREGDYIDALLAMYKDHDRIPFGRRVQAYLKAMEALAQRYPDDDEAQIGYAITLNVAASPNDKTYAYQLKGAAILEPIFKRQPRHPGVAHYLIHLYDYPAIAEKGLDAARRYAAIAPAAPHAQHMPSHIFTRVGYWKESITGNTASARAAKASKEFSDQLHAMDYLVYAHLQLAQDKEARAVVDEMTGVKDHSPSVRGGWYAIAASQARYMIERNDWKGAAQLQVQPTRFPSAGRGAFRQSGGGERGCRQAHRAARQAPAGQRCLLVGTGRYPMAGRDRVDAPREGAARRGTQSDERGSRCRGQDREVDRDSGTARAGARALRRDAADARHAEGGARRLRGDVGQGAEPLQCVRRGGKGRRRAR
jgi:hypothetical protein